MNLLAIETATERCSVALLHRGALIERSELAPRRHAELVLPMAAELLAEAGLARSALDGIAVGRGPGAFTGVRLAVSMAQGLALGLDLPVVPVSTLAALAMQALPADGIILALLDARMGEVYAGRFVLADDNLVRPAGEEQVLPPAELALPGEPGWVGIGPGFAAYRDKLDANQMATAARIDAAALPEARDVARLAAPVLAAGGGVAAELALPVYLRDKVAETTAERARKRP